MLCSVLPAGLFSPLPPLPELFQSCVLLPFFCQGEEALLHFTPLWKVKDLLCLLLAGLS
jgi:hypothetical protein